MYALLIGAMGDIGPPINVARLATDDHIAWVSGDHPNAYIAVRGRYVATDVRDAL